MAVDSQPSLPSGSAAAAAATAASPISTASSLSPFRLLCRAGVPTAQQLLAYTFGTEWPAGAREAG